MNVTARLSEIASQAAQLFPDTAEPGQHVVTPLPGLRVIRQTHVSSLEATFYEPVICLILQGRKETIVGDRLFSFGAGESLIVSHDLAVVSRITAATPASPYLALILVVDLGILRGLYEQVSDLVLETRQTSAAAVHTTDEALIDAIGRYVALAGKPWEQDVLAPLLLKEIHFRLLLAPHGAMLRQLLLHKSHASTITRAIEQIRRHFREPLNMAALAQDIGMSASSFHKHFKAITATTPLQYQKELRLLEARRLLLTDHCSVTEAAFAVGYESATQFSREYARKFGASPRHDLVVDQR